MHFKHCRRRRMFPATESANTTPYFRLPRPCPCPALPPTATPTLLAQTYLALRCGCVAWLVCNYLFHTRSKCSILLCVDKNYGNAASCYLYGNFIASAWVCVCVRVCGVFLKRFHATTLRPTSDRITTGRCLPAESSATSSSSSSNN